MSRDQHWPNAGNEMRESKFTHIYSVDGNSQTESINIDMIDKVK